MSESEGEVRIPDLRYARVPDRLIRDREVSDRAFRLWCLLCRYGEQRSWPKRATLATELGSTPRAVTNWIRQLRDGGYLSIEQRPGRHHIVDLGPAWGPGPWNDGSRDPGTTVPGSIGKENQGKKAPPMPPQDWKREQEVLDLFNELVGTRLTSEAYLQRIRRRWPRGWTVAEWRVAIRGFLADRWWEREGGSKPDPGTLIGGSDGLLLARHYERGLEGKPKPGGANQPQGAPNDVARVAHLAALNAAREAAGQEPLTELPGGTDE